MGKTSYEAAVEVVSEISTLCDKLKKYEPKASDQLYRATTSVSANLAEAKYAESNADFIHKLEIAQKECFEAETWLQHFHNNGYLKDETFKNTRNKLGRIRRMLISSVVTVKKKMK